MTTNDNKDAENLMKDVGGMLPLGTVPTEDVAAVPIVRKKPSGAPGSIPLKKRQHEQIAQLVAYEDRTFAQAYAQVYRTDRDSRANASRLKRDHPEIVERISFLDREIKDEAMLHRGSTFVDTINDVSAVKNTMMARKSDPKAAAIVLKAAEIILKATGNEAPATTTVEETAEATSTNPLSGLDERLRRVVRTTVVK